MPPEWMAGAVCSAVFFFNYTQALARNVTNENAFFKHLSDTNNYDKRIRPTGENYPAPGGLAVGYDVEYIYLGPLDSTLMELDVSFYLRARWRDERLQYPATVGGDQDYITMDYNSIKQIWLPHIYINSGLAYTDYSHFDILAQVYPNGTIFYSQRVIQKIKCFMNLHNFPHDIQTCKLVLTQYTYNEDHIKLDWFTGSFTKESNKYETLHSRPPDKYLAEFSIVGFSRTAYSEEFIQTGTFSGVSSEIHFKREIVFYIVTVYIPSGLIVILSWAAFWVPYEESDARVTVGLIPVLTITEVIQYSKSNMPKVNYLMAIDYWLFAHLLFVVASFLEYVFTHVLISQIQYIHRKLHEALERREVKEAEERMLEEQAAMDRQRYEDMKKDLKGPSEDLFALMAPKKPKKYSKPKKKTNVGFIKSSNVNEEQDAITSNDKISHHSDPERQKPDSSNTTVATTLATRADAAAPGTKTPAGGEDDASGEPLSASLAKKKKQKPKKMSTGNRFINQMNDVITTVDLSGRKFENKIDRGSRVVFPVVYLILNLLYWMIELQELDDFPHP